MEKKRNYLEGITEENCNQRLSLLYHERDKIGEEIDHFIWMDRQDTVHAKEREYDKVCEEIDALVEYRRNHDCKI